MSDDSLAGTHPVSITKEITVIDDFTGVTSVKTLTESFTITISIPDPPTPIHTCPIYGTWYFSDDW